MSYGVRPTDLPPWSSSARNLWNEVERECSKLVARVCAVMICNGLISFLCIGINVQNVRIDIQRNLQPLHICSPVDSVLACQRRCFNSLCYTSLPTKRDSGSNVTLKKYDYTGRLYKEDCRFTRITNRVICLKGGRSRTGVS